jgi:hypothetical protein
LPPIAQIRVLMMDIIAWGDGGAAVAHSVTPSS